MGGGAPRFSIPVDDPATAVKVDAYAFLDVNNCGSDLVSTDSSNCQVHLNSGPSYTNWNAFAEANPTYKVSAGEIPFIIADGSLGTFSFSNIVLC